tara:strand:- start:8317 stop:8958 length:642 start_codon:yes stop_codon:yes gene_type:complete
MNNLYRLTCMMALAAALSGCALANVAGGPAPKMFTLTAHNVAATSGDVSAAGKADLLVDGYFASAAIDTGRIAYLPSPNELKYIAGARWADLAPVMIQTLTVETLEKSGRFASVAARGSEINGDYMLKGDIRQFAAEKNGDATQVHVDLFMRLVSRNDNKVVATKDFNVLLPVSGSGIEPMVAAFDAALAQALSDLTVWTAGELSGARELAAK